MPNTYKPMPSPRNTNHERRFVRSSVLGALDAAPGEEISVEDVLEWIKSNLSPEDVAGLVKALAVPAEDEDDDKDAGKKDDGSLNARWREEARRVTGDGRPRQRPMSSSESYEKMFPNANRLYR